MRSTVAVARASLTVRRNGVAVGHQKVNSGRRQPLPLRRAGAAAHPAPTATKSRSTSEGDTRPQNDALGTTVRVQGPPRVLVAGADGSTAAELLGADGFEVTPVAAERAAVERRRLQGLRRRSSSKTSPTKNSANAGQGDRRRGPRPRPRPAGARRRTLLLARQVLQIAAPGSAAGEKPRAGQTAAQKRRGRARPRPLRQHDQRGRRGAEDRDGAGGGARRGRIPAQTPRPDRHRHLRNQTENGGAADPGRTGQRQARSKRRSTRSRPTAAPTSTKASAEGVKEIETLDGQRAPHHPAHRRDQRTRHLRRNCCRG